MPYRTSWIELADVDNTLRVIGAPPSGARSDGRATYSLPVLVDPTANPASPTIVTSASTIAEYLEAAYPARPVFPEGSRAVQTLFVHYVQEVFMKPLLPILVPLSHRRLPRSSGGGDEPGDPSRQTIPPGPQREHAWRAVQDQFNFLHSIMSKNIGDGDGVLTMGYGVFSWHVKSEAKSIG